MSAAQTSATGYQEEDSENNSDANKFTKDDLFVVKCTIHHGCKEKNPVSRIHFLEKPAVHGERGYMVASHLCQEPSIDSLPEAFKVDETDYPFPSTFQKTIIHVYSKTEDKRMPIGNAFKRWWSEMSNATQDPLQSTRSAESSGLLEGDFTSFNYDCTSKNGSMLATSLSEAEDMPTLSLARMLTQESDDEDDDENLDFDEHQEGRFESNLLWMSSR